MLTISILFLILDISCGRAVSFKFTNIINSRIISLVFIYSALLSINGLHFDEIASGIDLFCGIFTISVVQAYVDILFIILQAMIIFI